MKNIPKHRANISDIVDDISELSDTSNEPELYPHNVATTMDAEHNSNDKKINNETK